MTKTELLKLIDKQELNAKNIIAVTSEKDYYLIGKIFKSNIGFMPLLEYDNNLKCTGNFSELDIQEIWYGDAFGNKNFDPYHKIECIWKRNKNRQYYNRAIVSWIRNNYPENDEIFDDIEHYINKHPNQRFGQIICNYICPDYRSNTSVYTKLLMDKWFLKNSDPFFEESKETYNRLCESDNM